MRVCTRSVTRDVFATVALGALAACAGRVSRAAPVPAIPQLLVWRADALASTRARIAANDTALRPAYEVLIAQARHALTVGPFAVTDKPHVAPSGDRHDYMSMAPYWWPDSTRPNGLPYVRRDGVVNEAGRRDSDSPRFGMLADAVQTLALAYYFSGEAAYARRAAMLVRTWFLDPATRMNPNLRYAQAIPGVTEGRGIGIIDLRDLPLVLDATTLLQASPAWTSRDRAGLVAWCRAYRAWMDTSANARDERAAKNNHGVWFDEQAVALALFVGDTAGARTILRSSVPQRIASQITPTGAQPLEAARTRPVHYMLFNIEPLERLAAMGERIGVDLWHYRAPSGGSLRGALDFIAPYADPAVRWPTPDVMVVEPSEFVLPLRRAAAAYGNAAVAPALARLPHAAVVADRSRLLYPDAP